MNARPLRVLLLCESLGVTGGVERFVCQLGNALAAKGMEVTLGNVDTPRDGMAYAVDAHVRVLSAGVSLDAESAGPGGSWSMLRTRWTVGHALGRVIDIAKADVIVLNGLVTACSVLAVKRDIAPRTVCCDHNHFAARSTLWQRLRAWLYPKVAAVVSLTEADAPRFKALNANTRVIANSSSLRADWPALPNVPLALAVGRHQAQKGFDLLLEAWVEVAALLPEARLRIVGDGPLRDAHVERSKALGLDGSVAFLPATHRIEPLFREAAVFVLPSRYEGMPLALLEAQALGVPAVAFDCPTGPRDIVTAETGILVPCEDTAALSRALVDVLSDRSRRAAMGHAAIARAKAIFSPERQMDAWAALLREVAATSAAKAAAKATAAA